MVEATDDYLDGDVHVEYNPYEERPLNQAYVLSHPHMNSHARALIEALRMEACGHDITYALMGLARACSARIHVGCKDSAGKMHAMSGKELRHLGLTLVNVFSNAGPHMAEWFCEKFAVRDDMRRRRLWHEVTKHSPLRTPQLGVIYFSWDAYVQNVCERGPRLVTKNERGEYVVDLHTQADFDDPVVRKTVFDVARFSCLGTVECRFPATASPKKVGCMAEVVMETAMRIQEYLTEYEIETMRDMEALFACLNRETGGFVPKKPLTPGEWLTRTLG
jgi:hypothetical protein